MGYNSPTYDKEAATASKSTKMLEAELKKFQNTVNNWTPGLCDTPPPMFNEHIQYLKMKIAERIGK